MKITEQTPSVPQYFSWINSTNEGSTERQTLINLDYFAWMLRTYGMQLAIYAWDAGNLDGASGTYEKLDGEKLRKQYPRGYGPIAARAGELGIRLGVWGGADGYGNTPEEEAARRELLVSLCRDFRFRLFKFDTVCGSLRPEKQDAFAETMRQCRKYSPDLIVLNHRNDLGYAGDAATTFLWGGVETYVDVFLRNGKTAPHNREGALERGLVPGLRRLTEDHGVCLSSCLDFFEDDLVLQAFNRSLILAPELYGNPWLLRDDEQPRLARIFNLAARWDKLLVHGITLPESYGEYAVARGDAHTRILTLRNASWEPLTVRVNFAEVGLAECAKVIVHERHPYERARTYAYNEPAEVTVAPYRVSLVEVADAAHAGWYLTDCCYEVVRELPGEPVEVKLLRADGEVRLHHGDTERVLTEAHLDETLPDPVRLLPGIVDHVPYSAETLYEATMFALDNDSLEYRSLLRSGETKVPEVKAARDAFFDQDTYRFRGCESRALFDGNDATFFDTKTKCYNIRVDGGCLRVDFGAVIDADTVELTCFEIDEPTREIMPQTYRANAEYSRDLTAFRSAPHLHITDAGACEAPSVILRVHNIVQRAGRMKKVTYAVGALRYFRLMDPPDRIYHVRLYKNGAEVKPETPHANNMMAHPRRRPVVDMRAQTVTLPDVLPRGAYLAAALEGVHGKEGAYVAAVCEDKLLGFPTRAPSYPSNVWEHIVAATDANNTYYLPLTSDMAGKRVTICTLAVCAEHLAFHTDVWLCAGNLATEGVRVIYGAADQPRALPGAI
ncbi:MAG: hypothetical protein ACOXZM_03710 [Eubacteriales bacterium]